jgi:hypothetical protein
VAKDESGGRRVFAKNRIHHRSRPQVQDSKLRSRLKAQLTKFSSDLCEGLSRPLEKFMSQMLFGIQASQDVKLSNIARSLKEDYEVSIPLKHGVALVCAAILTGRSAIPEWSVAFI